MEINTIRVSLGSGITAWVMILNFEGAPCVLTTLDESKLRRFRTIFELPEELPECSTISVSEFEEHIRAYPILSSVEDWERMGIPIKPKTGFLT